MDYNSSNVIYKLSCNRCAAFYIGQTGDSLKKRMTVHRQQITHVAYSILGVSKHIRECGRGFTIAPFYLLPPESGRLQRESKESMFISKFYPQLNSIWILSLPFPFGLISFLWPVSQAYIICIPMLISNIFIILCALTSCSSAQRNALALIINCVKTYNGFDFLFFGIFFDFTFNICFSNLFVLRARIYGTVSSDV